MTSILKYAKAIVALLLSLATAAVTYFPSDTNVQLYGGVGLAVLAAVSVALVKNSPANDLAVLTAVEHTGFISGHSDEVLLKVIGLLEQHITPPKVPAAAVTGVPVPPAWTVGDLPPVGTASITTTSTNPAPAAPPAPPADPLPDDVPPPTVGVLP